ncbi:MAG: rhodanese-like domain-containing protein [Litorilinea sp.]
MADEYISPDELHAQLDGPETPLIIDVRGAEEFDAGHILGAVHIPGDELAQRLDEIPVNRAVVPY